MAYLSSWSKIRFLIWQFVHLATSYPVEKVLAQRHENLTGPGETLVLAQAQLLLE